MRQSTRMQRISTTAQQFQPRHFSAGMTHKCLPWCTESRFEQAMRTFRIPNRTPNDMIAAHTVYGCTEQRTLPALCIHHNNVQSAARPASAYTAATGNKRPKPSPAAVTTRHTPQWLHATHDKRSTHHPLPPHKLLLRRLLHTTAVPA